MDTSKKFETLKDNLRAYERVLVAFSGGVDSAFVLWAAAQVLPKENVFAVTAVSPSLAPEELEEAKELAQRFGIGKNHWLIETKELEIEGYRANQPSRCFFCKDELYSKLSELAEEHSIPHILDGFNASDDGDFRPGRKAGEKWRIKSPLLEAGLTKTEIREIARTHNLSFWDKPQMACLSSRIPYGEEVTVEKLSQVGQAEKFLHQLGFRQVRVRHHEKIARIEVEPEEWSRFSDFELRSQIQQKLRAFGFLYVTLDLVGYRAGSLNEALQKGSSNGG
ncbi:MAG: ATP-dependent sacrificial sulfur transferase LarE [candidate division Zixibacteria bacterium]|nr:ATP-dependent sacrificial sulfur transferase LarE [candidate division Zixibacteria bacterium]